jgi:hypothetical protein
MTTKISFVLKPDHLAAFAPLLQQGVQVEAQVGCDIQSLLCDQFQFLPDYLADRINTIFLNGKPVDDVGLALVADGDTLALSASMPGLVGATFRKGGCLASFRGSISYRKGETETAACQDGTITLKLFNLLIPEMGPLFLERGVWISGHALHACLDGYAGDLKTIVVRLEYDGRPIDPAKMGDLKSITPDARVRLQATCEP